MLRSLYAGVSGLKAHMTKMDVIGNNISNVNTTGYKSSRATFKTMFSQTVQGASAPQEGRGGTNPQQVGLGVSLGSIDKNMGQGNLQSTGINTDLAIDGEGFFIMESGTGPVYSRAGASTFDRDGYLVNSTTGYRMQGWMADANGDINLNGNLTDITLKQSMPAQATDKIPYSGNLDADAEVGKADATNITTVDVYDSLGTTHKVQLEFTKTANNEWNYEITDIGGVDDINNATLNGNGDLTGTITFDETNGNIATIDGESIGDIENGNADFPVLSFTPSGGGIIPTDPISADSPTPITLDFSSIKQRSGAMSADADTPTGYKAGSIKKFAADSSGTITGLYDNGMKQTIGRVALATFNNPAGLTEEGSTVYRTSNNSGLARVGSPGDNGVGVVRAGSLEMSNVDLSGEMTEMITTQRGFQANSKIISTGDQILEQLVNLKR
ncbi:flagellar hook protein FlgE [Orenia metallireducens]|uniref:Flagellar hook protein FlgE n=1 Tax=Orenia metallireducens TaxID=1413210 RepID=A0A285FSB4_9FIRM|nr:flagellar hook protein FlgE [Orenia metallireducens]PRX33669.1 flagellar hook protein FlgE [Orenia metallireducens]SNY13101.1 flagellar hook protein FlgE [Orenia metallireducens]